MREQDPAAVKDAIRAEALGLGFDVVGFAAPSLGPGTADHLASYLADGRHGDMGWMDNPRRADPHLIWAAARAAVVVGMSYAPAIDPLAIHGRPDKGAISIYAQRPDYHDVLKKRLKGLGRWLHRTYAAEVKVFVDTAPILEKPLAMSAGIGWQGKHTNLLSPRFGSWLFLGEMLTTLALPPDQPATDHCGSCDACRAACPTGALPEPYRIEPRACISYLTIEHKTTIAPEFRAAMGNRIYGCDDCLSVCPWNKFAEPTDASAFPPRPELAAPDLARLAGLDDAAFRALFAGTSIKRTGRDRFLRNVMIAIGNSNDPALAPVAEAALGDPSPLVRAMAAWALSRLVDGERFNGLKRRRLAAETDADVRAEWERKPMPSPRPSPASGRGRHP